VILAQLQHDVAFSLLALESIAQTIVPAVLDVAHNSSSLLLALSVAFLSAAQALELVPRFLPSGQAFSNSATSLISG